MSVCRNYSQHAGNNSFYFNSITAEFPSITSAYKVRKTIDLYLHVENDQYWGKVKSDGDCGVFLSLREDVRAMAGEDLVAEVIQKIYGIFADCRVLFHKRPWWSQTEGEESGLQDVAPWRLITQPQYYQNWVELESGIPIMSPA